MKRRLFRLCLFFAMMLRALPCAAADPPKVAGPYKLLAADFTGNGHRDLVIGLTACSAYDSNGGSFKPIDYRID